MKLHFVDPPSWLVEGVFCQRRPCGRICRVRKVDRNAQSALVKDLGHAVWVSFDTLCKSWQPVGTAP